MAAVTPSPSLNIAEPATRTSAPAATASGAVGDIDPAVDLEVAPRFDPIDHLAGTTDLRERRVEEMLMPESRVHRHDQHLVEVLA